MEFDIFSKNDSLSHQASKTLVSIQHPRSLETKEIKHKHHLANRDYIVVMAGDITGSKPLGSGTGGVYRVRESGLEFQYMPKDTSSPKDGEEFLAQFRCVIRNWPC